MNAEEFDNYAGKIVGRWQIVVGGMAFGAAGFLILALVVRIESPGMSPTPILTYVAAAWGLISVLGYLFLPSTITERGRRQIASGASRHMSDASVPDAAALSDAAQLLALYGQATIIRCATVEGGALLAGVAYMKEREGLALGIGIGLVLLVAAQIPTATRVKAWVVEQLAVIEQIRPPSV